MLMCVIAIWGIIGRCCASKFVCVSLLEVENQISLLLVALIRPPCLPHTPINRKKKVDTCTRISFSLCYGQVGKIGYLDDEPRVEGDARERGQDPVERAGAEVDERVGGEQRRRHGRPGGARAAVLDENLKRQQWQHPSRRPGTEAAPPATAHAGPHLRDRRSRN